MATPLINPFLRYFTVSGTLAGLAGGKLKFYIGGTDTPKAVYSDASGTTSLGPEVTLNGVGMSQIWLGDGAYKVVLTDADDNIIDTADNIQGLQSFLQIENISELRALESGGSDFIMVSGYYASGDNKPRWYYWDSASTASDNGGTIIIPNSSPAAGRWRMLDAYDITVHDFGAKGDGSTDDTTFIQACINATGGNFSLGEGLTYITSARLDLTGLSYFTIDMNSSTIKMEDGTAVSGGFHMIYFSSCSYFTVKNGTFDANRDNRTPDEVSAQTIWLGSNVTDFKFDKVYSMNAVVDGWYLASSDPTDASTHAARGDFIDCGADNGYRQGMSMIQGNNINIIGGFYTGTNGTNPQAGIDLESNVGDANDSINNINIFGAKITGNTGFGVLITSIALTRKVTVRGCNISSNLAGGISVQGEDCTIDDNSFDGYTDSITEGIINSTVASTMEGTIISNNRFTNITAGAGKACIAMDATNLPYDIFGNLFYEIPCIAVVLEAQGSKYHHNRHIDCTGNNLVTLARDNMICNDNYFTGHTGNVTISSSRDNQEVKRNRFLSAVGTSPVINFTSGAERARIDDNYFKFASSTTNVAISLTDTFQSLTHNVVENATDVTTFITLTGGAATEAIGQQFGNLCIQDTGFERLPANGGGFGYLDVINDDEAYANLRSDRQNASGTNGDSAVRHFIDGGATAKIAYGYDQSQNAFLMGYDINALGGNRVLRIAVNTGNMQTYGSLIHSGVETIAAGGGTTALSINKNLHYIDADAGGDIFTMADGSNGEFKTVICASATGVCTVTPANFSAGTSVTLNAAGQSAVFRFMDGNWHLVGGYGYTVI